MQAVLPTIILAALVAASGGWLDVPLRNWNVPGAAIPKAPKPESDAELRARCGEQGRPPSSAADRALVAAGWTLYGPLQSFGDASLIVAGSDVDGMCRPLGYQGFVFVGDVLAGTIAPAPMNSRSDGAETEAMLTGSRAAYAEFSRYGEKDPLCCPSRQSTVTYVIEGEPGKPLLVPQSAFTQPTGSSS